MRTGLLPSSNRQRCERDLSSDISAENVHLGIG